MKRRIFCFLALICFMMVAGCSTKKSVENQVPFSPAPTTAEVPTVAVEQTPEPVPTTAGVPTIAVEQTPKPVPTTAEVPTPAAEQTPKPVPSAVPEGTQGIVPTATPVLSLSAAPTAGTKSEGNSVPTKAPVTEASSGATGTSSAGTWQLKYTTGKKYVILGTDDDNIGNPLFFRLLRTYSFPYTMNTEAENAVPPKQLGPDTDDAIFTEEDAPALFPEGVDVVTLGRYLQEHQLGEVAQHGSSQMTLWDSKKLTGDFFDALYENYRQEGGKKTMEELKAAITEQLAETDGSQGAVYIERSRALLEEAFGFPVETAGIWGGSPIAKIDGIECSLNRIKGTSDYDWKGKGYTAVGTVLGSLKANHSTYDMPRIACGVDEVINYIDKMEPDKACEFFWHMPFRDEPDITKWRTLFDSIRSLVDQGRVEVITRKQYAELGEWVENPILGIAVERREMYVGDRDSEESYTVIATYQDQSRADVTMEALLDRSGVNTEKSGSYTVTAYYRGFSATGTVSVIDKASAGLAGSEKTEDTSVGQNDTFRILSNAEHYVKGYYKHWGGAFAEAEDSVCATELVPVSGDVFYYYSSDPHIVVTIQQYDKDKKWIEPKEEYRKLERGAKITTESNTAYISVTLRSLVWGVDIIKLLEQGLVVGFSDTMPDFSTPSKEDQTAGSEKELQPLSAAEFLREMTVGWNLGNSLDCKGNIRGLDANSKQELAWFNPYVEKQLIDYVAQCGFSTIRIPVTWYYNSGVDSEGNLVLGENFLARVRQVVDYAVENGLYVIINSHHDDEMIYAGVEEAEMEQVLKTAESLWRQIAMYFRDYDEHLIFESYNEVDNRELGWTFSEKAAEQMNRLNQVFVDTVRETGGNNAQRLLMVPTLIDKYKEPMLQTFVVPRDTVQDRLIVQVHAYNQVFFQTIENDFSLLERYAKQWGVPVIIGEFGTTSEYFEPALRRVHAANFIARAASHGIKCIWWDNGGDYGILDRRNFENSDTDMIQALFAGLKGEVCQLPQAIILNRPEDFTDGVVQDKEIVVNPYWGCLTTDRDGEPIALPEGRSCMLSLTAQGDTSEVWLGSVTFYDQNREVVELTRADLTSTTTTIKALSWTCRIPENARYIRVSLYSPFTSISREVYDQSLLSGKLSLSIAVFDSEEVGLTQELK